MGPPSESHGNASRVRNPSPVGTGNYVVRPGDCIDSIAFNYGFLWQTIWTAAGNAELRAVRRDPNVLLPGDRVTIPPLRLRTESAPTDQRHKFRRHGVPARLRIRILRWEAPADEELDLSGCDASLPGADGAAYDPPPSGGPRSDSDTQSDTSGQPQDDSPWAGLPYIIEVAGTTVRGTTNGDGWIETTIPPNARRGTLRLQPEGQPERVMGIDLGHLDPVDHVRGLQQRLRNLSFPCPLTGVLDPATSQAIRRFQAQQGLPQTGEPDEPTSQRLREAHNS